MGYMGMDAFSSSDYKEIDYLVEKLIPSKDEVYIFGRGTYGKAFARYLATIDCVIDGFIVSDDCENEHKY